MFPQVGRAWNGFPPVSPEDLKLTSEQKAPGAAAIVLYREVDRDDSKANSVEQNYVRIKVLTEEGRKYADVEIAYEKESSNISGIKARTIRPDGSVANADVKVFDRNIVKGKGIRYLAKTFTLPDVQVGSILEYSFNRDFKEYTLFDSHWTLSDELFTKYGKFSLKPYVGTYEPWNVRWSWQGLPPEAPGPAEGPDHVVRLEVTNVPAFQSEDYMPPETEMQARVDFIYSQEFIDFRDPGAKDKFWKNMGKKWNGSLESFVNKRKAMEQAVSQMVAPGDTPEVKLQKIYARVQQFRNTSYEVEKTEQQQKREKEKDATNVEELWKLGYGNGRDLTWLFMALARAAGFEAYGVWVADRRNYFFNPNMLDGHKLDANVVLVKVDGKDRYFDPGAAFTPYGLLPWVETSVPGLRLDKDGGSWVTTDLPVSSSSQINRSATLKISAETGGLEGKLTVTYTGLEALRRRVEERNEDETAHKKFLEDEVKGWVPAAIDVELTNKPNWSSSENILVAEFDLKVPGWVSGAGRRALLPIGLFGGGEKHVFDHAERVHPIYFSFPSKDVDDITVELPEGWKVSTLPKEQVVDAGAVSYSTKATAEQNKLHVTRKLDLNILLVEQKNYGVLRTLFMAARSGDEQQIVLQPGVATAAN
jgi:hypothetical protein